MCQFGDPRLLVPVDTQKRAQIDTPLHLHGIGEHLDHHDIPGFGGDVVAFSCLLFEPPNIRHFHFWNVMFAPSFSQ